MSIQDVILQLERLYELHVQLLELAREKKDVLIRSDVDRLMEIVTLETRIMKQVPSLEQSWRDAVLAFLREKGVASGQMITMSELAKLVFQVDQKSSLLDMQGKLQRTLKDLQELNALNQSLIEHSLQYVNYNLSLMVDDPMENVIYKNPASTHGKPGGQSIFNAKI